MRLGRPIKTTMCIAALVAAAGATGAGCGSGDDDSGGSSGGGSSGGNVSAAKAIVSKATQVPEFTLKAPAFDASKARGKTIFNIVFRSADAYIAAQAKQMQAIAKQYGINFVSYQNQGTPNEWSAGVEQAIAQHADLIMIENPPEAILPALKKAKAAGIPVELLHWYATGLPVTPVAAPYVTAHVTAPFYPAHKVDVAYAVTQTKGPVNALIVWSSDITASKGIVEHMKQDFADLCGSDCKVKLLDVPATQWATKIGPGVRTALNQDPSINWVMPIFDAMSLTAAPAIQAAGKAAKVKIATFNGTPSVMNLMNTGDILAADVGENVNWLGYAFMDQGMRILTGTKPIADGNEEIAFRLFTKENIAEAGNPTQPDKGYGDAYVKGYTKLWSGGK